MQRGQAQAPAGSAAQLTGKQHEVLSLLLQHKTSKEIARDLGISPHTVEQRLRFAKDRLGVSRRGDLANAYRQLQQPCDKPLYEEMRIETNALPLPQEGRPGERPERQPTQQLALAIAAADGPLQDVSLVPAIMTGRNGALMRIAAIVGIAAAVITVSIGGLAVLEQLSRLIG
jgi:DNA-binding CsgD family transcriptional regulator